MRIYILDISKCNNKKLFSLYDNDPEYRREKFDRTKNISDKLRILGGSFLLAHISKEYNFPYELLSASADGKPFFKGASFSVSLSNKENICAAVLSDSPVGIDVELKKQQKISLSSRYFSKKEILLLEKSSDKDLTFTEIWTRKEAFFKAASPRNYTLSALCTADRFATFENITYELMTFCEDNFVFSACKEGTIDKVIKTHICI